jgi:hypothetical protein
MLFQSLQYKQVPEQTYAAYFSLNSSTYILHKKASRNDKLPTVKKPTEIQWGIISFMSLLLALPLPLQYLHVLHLLPFFSCAHHSSLPFSTPLFLKYLYLLSSFLLHLFTIHFIYASYHNSSPHFLLSFMPFPPLCLLLCNTLQNNKNMLYCMSHYFNIPSKVLIHLIVCKQA